jgi:hypothetical protein
LFGNCKLLNIVSNDGKLIIGNKNKLDCKNWNLIYTLFYKPRHRMEDPRGRNNNLKVLETERNQILLVEEALWRQRSRALWIKCGDQKHKKISSVC